MQIATATVPDSRPAQWKNAHVNVIYIASNSIGNSYRSVILESADSE